MRENKHLLVAAVAVAMIAAACGAGSDAASTTVAAPTTTAAPATTSTTSVATTSATTEELTFTGADGVDVTVDDTSRIVSLSGDLTEIIFELGLGEKVVAVDVTTTYPETAADLPKIGFAQQLAPEPVLAFEPTLVLADRLTAPQEAIDQLRQAGVPLVVLESQTSLDGVGTKIRQVAEILGASAEGEALATRVEGEITAARELATQAEDTPNVAFIYARGPQVVLLFGDGMATQSIIESAHATDTGAASGVFGAAPLTPEAFAAAAPDVIVLPESGLAALGGIDGLLALPGIGETPAAEEGRFLSYDEAYFFNLGPRAGQALMEFVKDLHPELADPA